MQIYFQPGGIYCGHHQMAGALSWTDFRENINIVIVNSVTCKPCVLNDMYVNIDSPNLGFTYFNFLGEVKCNNTSRTDVAPWCYKWMGWVGGLISGRGEA